MIDFQVEEPVCVGQSAKWFDGRRHAIHQETNVAHVCPALHPQPFDVGVCPLDSDRDVHGGERTGCSGPNQKRQGAAACAAAAGTAKRMVRLDDTCWWYSLCNFQYRPHYENTGSDHFDG